MNIKIPVPSLILLVGPSGAGKSTFAATHFLPTEVVSSDHCRALVSDDVNDQSATPEAFELVRTIASLRLRRGLLTVIDATNVRPEDRKKMVAIAREHDVFAHAIVLTLPVDVCYARNKDRPDRDFGVGVIRAQHGMLRRSMRGMKREGFRSTFVLKDEETIQSVTIERTKLWTDRRDESGPFDIIGDVHGCASELENLLSELGYTAEPHEEDHPLAWPTLYRHPEGRRVIFVGDLVDRGPRILDSVRIASTMVRAEVALCVPGNHETKLLRKLQGRNVQITHGLEETLAEIAALPEETRAPTEAALVEFIEGLISHYVLDEGRLVVAHAGMKECYQGRSSGRVREFALYGETTGETDEFGFPVRHDWASEYRGSATVVYGHTPIPEPQWLNHTVNVDTGCVFGGGLTALRYPETEFVTVPAEKTYTEAKRPFLEEGTQAPFATQQESDRQLDIEDVDGKRQISTPLAGRVSIRAAHAAAALEVMSRFAVDPRWLCYLPPTMSPCESSQLDNYLEHPREAFTYFRNQGVPRVVAEEKHMGSRAVCIVGKDEDSLRTRFGVEESGLGVIYTRTGRPFFRERSTEQDLLGRLREACTAAKLWETLETDWLVLDTELMPWSAKAQSLIRDQYAAAGAAGELALRHLRPHLEGLVGRGLPLPKSREEDPDSKAPIGAEELLAQSVRRSEKIGQYRKAYRHYCWPVESLDDYRLAPFHLMAAEGSVFIDRDHHWHMETLATLAKTGDPIFVATPYRTIDLIDPASEQDATAWWEELTTAGGEGFVVKPLDFVTRGRKGTVQPAIKCRGSEYLRIIYGPEYDTPENLTRLRTRGLQSKRLLAKREFALGVEGLQRFVRREPLRRIHECVFSVLALESEPVDPRL